MKKDNLNHRITIRMDDALYMKIANGAKNAAISQVEYARRLLKSGKVVIRQEVIADVPQLKRLIAEFGKIGSNINQIAHHFNSGFPNTGDISQRLEKALSDLYAMKYQVEEMGGEFRGYSKARTGKKQ